MSRLEQVITESASDLPEMKQGNETEKLQDLTDTLLGKTRFGEEFQQAFSALNQNMQTYSKRPMPDKTIPQPAPEQTNSDRNSPSLSR